MLPGDVDTPVQSLDLPLGGVPGAEPMFPFATFALAPDGRQLALVMRTEGRQRLWLRELGSSRLSELPGPTPSACHSGRRIAGGLASLRTMRS